MNEAGEVVKTFRGLRGGEIPADIGLGEGEVTFDIEGGLMRDLHIGAWTISWDGSLDEAGTMIANGAYLVVVRLTGADGAWSEEIGTLVVMKVAGELKATVRDETGRLVRRLEASSGAGSLGQLRAEPALIRPGSGNEEVALIKAAGCELSMAGGAPLSWDGRNDNGVIVASGAYRVIVEKQHLDTGREICEVEVTVVSGAAGVIDDLVVYPNPRVVRRGEHTVRVAYEVIESGATVQVRLYDIAGELVLAVANRPGRGRGAAQRYEDAPTPARDARGKEYIELDVQRLAGGVYLVLVEAAADGSDRVFRRVVRLVVVK